MKWISVKDRLPDNIGITSKPLSVLVYIEGGGFADCEFEKGRFQISDDITHWTIPCKPNCDHTGDCLEEPEGSKQYLDVSDLVELVKPHFQNQLDDLRSSLKQNCDEVWDIIKSKDDEIKVLHRRIGRLELVDIEKQKYEQIRGNVK